MEKRMNKKELIELIETLNVDVSEFWLLSSAALVMRGIWDDAFDLDIAVTYKGLEQLRKNYELKPKGNGWYFVSDKIECVCDGDKEKLKYQPEKIGLYYVQNILEYYDFLINSDREKDKLRIPLVEQYIKKVK